MVMHRFFASMNTGPLWSGEMMCILNYGVLWSHGVECSACVLNGLLDSHSNSDNDFYVTLGSDKHHLYFNGKSIIKAYSISFLKNVWKICLNRETASRNHFITPKANCPLILESVGSQGDHQGNGVARDKKGPPPCIWTFYQLFGSGSYKNNLRAISIIITKLRERSGSVVECLTRDRRATSEPHCNVSLSKNINPSLVLVQPRKARPYITERLLMGRKESKQKVTKFTPYFNSNEPLKILQSKDTFHSTPCIATNEIVIAHKTEWLILVPNPSPNLGSYELRCSDMDIRYI